MVEINSTLETEVTSHLPDGGWTLSHKTTTLNMKVDGKEEDVSKDRDKLGLFDESFSVTMDSNKKILNLPQNKLGLAGLFGYINPVLLLPIQLLPDKPVKIGESWPIRIKNSWKHEDEVINESLEGTGTLRAINETQAFIDFVYTVRLKWQGDNGWRTEVKSVTIYDVNRSLFTSNKLEMTLETINWAFSDNENDIKSIFKSSTQVDLLNR